MAYTTKTTRNGMPNPASPIANPRMAIPSSKAKVKKIRKYTIALGMSLIKNM
jgi:hypothetical protein